MQTNSTTRHALAILNEAAENSADEIRRLVRRDFHKLNQILADVKPEITSAMSAAREKVTSGARRAVETVDASAHENAWTYIGAATACAVLFGFFLGRKSVLHG